MPDLITSRLSLDDLNELLRVSLICLLRRGLATFEDKLLLVEVEDELIGAGRLALAA